MINVAVFGAAGRMGRQVCDAVDKSEGMQVVARIDADDDPKTAVAQGATVVVDFTHPGVVLDNLEFCVRNGIHAVVGTSGFTPERLERLHGLLAEDPSVGVLV